MKRILRTTGALLLCSALFTPVAQAYLTVTGNAAAGTTFVTAPLAANFYKPTGEYYFGLTEDPATTGNFALCYGNYRTADVAPTLVALASNPGALYQQRVEKFAVVPYSSDLTAPTMVAAPVANAAATNTATKLQAVTKTYYTTPVASVDLNDTAGAVTGGIRALATSKGGTTSGADMVFIATAPNGAGGAAGVAFGSNAAGNALVNTYGINAALMTRDATTGAPIYTLGIDGAGTNASRAVDLTGTGSFVAYGGGSAMVASGANPAFYYDEVLQRLYVGIQARSTGITDTMAICGVGIYPVTKATTGVTVGAGFAPVAGGWNTFGGVDLIVGCTSADFAAGADVNISNIFTSIYKLKTMHTSTGLPYLIVNGNTGPTDLLNSTTASNQIFAVPLVSGTPSATNTVGCFASVNSGNHSVIAAAATDLVTATSAAAMVGGFGKISTTSAGAINITDMYVDGDAVYVAVGILAADQTTEPGLFKSQAIFNDLGQIVRWTDWQKVMPGEMGQTTTGADGRIDFAAVDGYTGHIWVTNKTSLTSKVSQWTLPTGTPSNQTLLAAAVNAALPNSLCYSVLDLNASTSGWGATTPVQVTVFGGQEKVCFAITGTAYSTTAVAQALGSTSLNGTYSSINNQLSGGATPGNPMYDYTQTSTFVAVPMPTGAGAVIALGFTGWNAANQGFLLAGCAGTATTAPALYAATINGTNGLTVGTFRGFTDATDLAVNAQWIQIANVAGMPVKIASMGGGLHVLTRSATVDRVYSTPAVATAALLNSSFVVTASSGVTPVTTGQSDLSAVKQIYDLVISVSANSTQPANGNEQLMIMTNDGIYTTSSFAGMQGNAAVVGGNLSQQNAGWVRLTAPTTNGFLTDYFGQPNYNRNPQSFWFGNWAANPASSNVYNQYIWYQMSRATFNVGGLNLVPSAITYSESPSNTVTYNGATSFAQTTAPTIYATFPVNARMLYDDGCRRYFVQKNPSNDGAYQVLVLPYNLYDYNITSNGKATMSDAVVSSASTIYWMGTAGDTGRLLMSTNNGIVALQ